ncbi:cysteine hydrolase [Halioxenophilus sp. WMMB6]|uniref:cysteine hydrolase family protein n=1 Tax=Halioxenophilus sp. WMMB6 TaxID=3073815 RepID=UPI00295E9553|nr:cysteine hydrolase [Halioxenophilus sp. WMMB6]
MKITVPAKPYPAEIDLTETAVVIIDMQKDFILPGGFGESLGNDVALLGAAVPPCEELLALARANNLLVIHTREGHRGDLSDVFPAKLERCKPSCKIGDPGPMGRILIRGEDGHDFVDSLKPLANEVVIEKPGKGAFYSTELDLILRRHHIKNLLVAGVTTEVCVSSTIREANDRGYNCVVVDECCGSYFPEFHRVALEMVAAQGGIFGFVCQLTDLTAAINKD